MNTQITTIRAIGVLALVILTLSACGGHKKKVEELTAETNRLGGEINQVFVSARENLALRSAMIQDAYEHKDRYDLSTEGMDVSEGGIYDWFEDWYYYPTEDKFQGKGMLAIYNGNHGMYLDPEVEYVPENFSTARKIAIDGPEIEAIKQEMRLWEHILIDVMKAGKNIGYTEFLYFENPRNGILIYSMYFDLASVMNPNFTHEITATLEWFNAGTPFGNPQGTPRWSVDAFADLAGEGWIENVSMPIYVHDRYTLLANNNIYPFEISKDLFRTHEQHLLFLSSSTSLLGISQPAQAALGLKELNDFDYVKQMQENAFIQDELKLTHDTQKPGMQELGAKVLAGETQFEVTIDGADYTVVVADIPEVHFYVVGLVKK